MLALTNAGSHSGVSYCTAQPRRVGSKSKADQREGESVEQPEAVQDGKILGALEAIATEAASSSVPVGVLGTTTAMVWHGGVSPGTASPSKRREQERVQIILWSYRARDVAAGSALAVAVRSHFGFGLLDDKPVRNDVGRTVEQRIRPAPPTLPTPSGYASHAELHPRGH